MCGIAGIYNFSEAGPDWEAPVSRAVETLFRRGPDTNGLFSSPRICLGHTRLSVIDTTSQAAQPFTDQSGRYTLAYNGEIYNFRELRKTLLEKGVSFRSQSDTEVLLYWLIHYGRNGLDDLQGFFAFAFFDREENSLLFARDRIGIKPLYFFRDENHMIFASEMKAMMAMGIPRRLDRTSLEIYLQLNYIPGPWSILEGVQKLMPGHWMTATPDGLQTGQYYRIGESTAFSSQQKEPPSYEKAKAQLKEKLEAAVVKRLVSDVPLGTFLSGGIDSSIITALASRHVDKLNTFSIGFRDEPHFDETRYARMVAEKYKTNHTVFSLTTNDLLDGLFPVLDYLDEPFADSSALAVYILSRETRQRVTVALSGDGADEMFAGYNKHLAEWKARNPGVSGNIIRRIYPLLKHLPQSRNSYITNKIRQIVRFGSGMQLDARQRYWQWACIAGHQEAMSLLKEKPQAGQADTRKNQWLKEIETDGEFGQVLLTDMQMVLPGDMLTKVDRMSMANSLEVRVPFLDHELVDFVFSLPSSYKIDGNGRKKILRDAFRDELPGELYHRGKQGFEVPMLRWLRNDLKPLLEEDLLDEDFLKGQNLFDPFQVAQLQKKLHSPNPGDAAARIWGLMVFQHWWKKYMG